MKTYYYLVRRTIVTAAFGLIIVATLIVPALACAQGNSPLADLQAQVTALQATVTSLQNQVNSLKTQFSAVQSNNALALGPFVSVDPNPENGVAGPNIKFIGANIHILSGSGATDDNLVAAGSLTGLGNLIIGYDETAPFGVVNRGGSHNLVIGRWHNFTSSAWGGLVAGESNTISAYAVSVLGGSQNTITLNAPYSSIVGGGQNTVTFAFSSILGGVFNVADGFESTICGGNSNKTTVAEATVVGGVNNTASSNDSVVLGGIDNTTSASGVNSVLLGGFQNTTSGAAHSISPQPPFP